MDIEKFTKGELITAALLLSFVTAILTGVVIMFLSEDAPRDVVRISEQVLTDESATSSITTDSESGSRVASEGREVGRDEIITVATEAIARVTGEDVPPQAGVLVRIEGELVIITTLADFSTNISALFQDGVVADLSLPAQSIGNFAQLPVVEAGGGLQPLSVSNKIPSEGDELFVVPLSALPEIEATTVTGVSDNFVTTTVAGLPAGSLLLDKSGALLGVFVPEASAFHRISTFTAQ